MAKYSRCEEDVQKLVHEVASELGLEQFMDFEALYVPKAKEVVSVSRASELTQYLSNRDDLIILVIYQKAFDLVEEKTQYMWIRMAMEQIYFDTEKDKIIIGKDNITLPISFVNKYEKLAIDTALSSYYTIAQIQEKEKEEKLKQKENKKRKK